MRLLEGFDVDEDSLIMTDRVSLTRYREKTYLLTYFRKHQRSRIRYETLCTDVTVSPDLVPTYRVGFRLRKPFHGS